MSNRLDVTDKTKVETQMGLGHRADQHFELNRAERLRAEAVGRMLGSLFTSIGGALGRFRETLARARRANELAALDDHMLSDIGMQRSDIPAFVAGQIAFAAKVVAEAESRRDKMQTAA